MDMDVRDTKCIYLCDYEFLEQLTMVYLTLKL